MAMKYLAKTVAHLSIFFHNLSSWYRFSFRCGLSVLYLLFWAVGYDFI